MLFPNHLHVPILNFQATPRTPNSSRSPRVSCTLSGQTPSRALENACKCHCLKMSQHSQSSFPDAVATIRRTGVEFQYQLVITRAYDEGEEQLLDEDAESEW